MANDLLKLANRLNKYADKIETSASDAVVKAATAILTKLSVTTPVDTSRALSSWIVTLDNPSSDKNLPYVHGKKGSSANASAKVMLRVGYAVLKTKKPGQTVYITNNQPYINELNNGSSQQQPAGFIERSVMVGNKELRKFKVK